MNNHFRFARTHREAFGYDHSPLCKRITFTKRPGAGWPAISVALILLVLAIAGAFK